MNNSSNTKYSYSNTIKSYETDALGRVSLANILYNFQEAANHHASILDWGLEYLNSINKFWILSRLKLQIYQYPKHKDDILIETWSRGAEGFFAYRDYRVLINGNCCMDAVTSWMILDKTTHRPCKIEQLGKEIPKSNESYLEFPNSKLQSPEKKKLLFEKKVNFSDIDINLHVNNGKYVEILTDAISDQLINSEVKELDIQYLHESHMNDMLAVYCDTTSWINAAGILFSMENISNSKETCRCRMKFVGK